MREEEKKNCITCETCDKDKVEGVTEEDMAEWGDTDINLDDFEDGDF